MSRRLWTDKQFISAVKNNISRAGVIKELGLEICGGNYRTINFTLSRLGLDTSHWLGCGWNKGKPSIMIGRPFKLKPLKEILTEGSDYPSSKLKPRLLKEGLLLKKCYICDLDNKWNDLPLVLVLDHINGEPSDSRLENLRLLCPNCNSQQPTFCRGNRPLIKDRSCTKCGRSPLARKNKTGYCYICAPTYRERG